MNAKWRRRKNIVNFQRQVWFSVEIVMVCVAFVLVLGFLLFVPPMSLILGEVSWAQGTLESLGRLLLIKWPMVLLSFVVVFFLGILMSHRLWGPLYGLKRALQNLEHGDQDVHVFFRKYDYIYELKDPLNQFFSRYTKESLELKEIEALIVAEKTQEALAKLQGLKLVEAVENEDHQL